MQLFKPKLRPNLLDEITRRRHHATEFAQHAAQPRPIIIVPAMISPGNLAITNAQQFLEKGVYTEDEKANPPKYVHNAQGCPIVEVKHKIGDKEYTFEVYDNV